MRTVMVHTLMVQGRIELRLCLAFSVLIIATLTISLGAQDALFA